MAKKTAKIKSALAERTCICGCRRRFIPRRDNQKVFSRDCNNRKWEARWLRRTPRREAETGQESIAIDSRSQTASEIVEVPDIRSALKTLATKRPEFFLRLAASVEAQKRKAAD
jgi:hypothetical protein